MSRTIYYDRDGKPRLMPSYCVFADFLGYRHEIKKAAERGEEEAVFQWFMEEIEPQIENTINPSPMDEIEGFPRMWDAKVFTDNVVLGYALCSDQGGKEFGHAITQLLEFQYAVALKGFFFVRGGWAIGNLFMNHNTVFGCSLLDAHELEGEADYPRVVLSKEMKDLVFRNMGEYADPLPYCYHLLVGEDNRLFTNYLSEAIVEDEICWDDLCTHSQIIVERLKEHRDNAKVHEKYEWLAAYHNFFCSLVCKADGYTDNVMVPGEFRTYGLHRLLHKE